MSTVQRRAEPRPHSPERDDGAELYLGRGDSECSQRLDLDEARRVLCTPGRALPFAAGSMRRIRCASLAGLDPPRLAALLRSCRRLLRPGGVLQLPEDGELRTLLEDSEDAPGLARLTGFAPEFRDLELVKPCRDEEPEPLVSVIIPAYKAEYFEECLRSAYGQSYRNLEIVISDDSEGERIEAIAKACAAGDPRIRYYKNEHNIGGRANHLRCFELARGAYIKWLDDDDTLHPECVERLLRCLQAHPEVALASARRQRIDAAGTPLDDDDHTRGIAIGDLILNGDRAIDRFLATGVNFIGEPTCALFRTADLEGTPPNIISFAGRIPCTAGDMAIWLTLLSKGELLLLGDTLSSRRIHASQGVMSCDNQQRLDRALAGMREDAVRLGLRIPAEGPSAPHRPLERRPWWPDELNDLDVLALEHATAGRWRKAHELWSRAILARPGSARLRTAAGEASMMLGDFAQASRELLGAIRCDSRCAPAYLGMATSLSMLGDVQQARECLSIAHALTPLATLERGFYPTEPHGTWMGLEGHVSIVRLLPMQAVSFELCTHPEVDYRDMPLRIELRADDEPLGAVVFEHPEECLRVLVELPVPRSNIDLGLRSSGAFTPKSNGAPPDTRCLSVYLRSLQFHPQKPRSEQSEGGR